MEKGGAAASVSGLTSYRRQSAEMQRLSCWKEGLHCDASGKVDWGEDRRG
jgi:hypothetical protein